MMQAQLMLATLAQRFRLELLPDAKVEIISGLMLHPEHLPVKAVPLS